MTLRNNTRHILITILAITLAFGGLLALVGCKSSEPKVDLEWEARCIWRTLDCTELKLEQQVSLEEKQDESGNPYLVGVLSDKLDGELQDLVNTYNTDPSTDKKVTVDEVRYNLTEGIVEFCMMDDADIALSPTFAFLRWCGDPAELEYNENQYKDDGSLVVSEGDPANQDGAISNYEFVTKVKDNSYLRYTWQKADKATAGN